MSDEKAIDQKALAGLICSRPQNFAWFLGAGASHSTGLPTASDLLWFMKRTYYCQEENQDVSRQDLQSPTVRTRIQDYMLSKGFPGEWADGEYPTYFEKIFGTDKERQRTYIHRRLSEENVTLNVGQRAFGALVALKLCRVAFSTNFDNVIEKAVAEVSGLAIAPFHLEGARAANAALNNEEYPVVCKLHGDFRYDSIKNLPEDLANQNADLSACLVNAAGRLGFIVTGYSGRDASVMALFRSALDQPNPFPHGLYWTHMSGALPIEPVRQLLAAARAKGVTAQAVPIETFDSLLLRIWRNLENRPAEIDAKVKKARLATASIPIASTGNARPILRLNALPILSLPKECLELSLNKPMEWTDLRSAQRDAGTRTILTKADAIIGWGAEAEIRTTFEAALTSIKSRSLPVDFSAPQKRSIKGLLEEALCVALARGKPLLVRNRQSHGTLIVDRHAVDVGALEPLTKLVGKTSGLVAGLFTMPDDEFPEKEQVSWSECLRVSITLKNGCPWILIDPDVWIWPIRARRIAESFLDERRGDRFNAPFNGLLDAWIEILFASSEKGQELEFRPYDGDASASNPTFKIGSRTGYTRRMAV